MLCLDRFELVNDHGIAISALVLRTAITAPVWRGETRCFSRRCDERKPQTYFRRAVLEFTVFRRNLTALPDKRQLLPLAAHALPFDIDAATHLQCHQRTRSPWAARRPPYVRRTANDNRSDPGRREEQSHGAKQGPHGARWQAPGGPCRRCHGRAYSTLS